MLAAQIKALADDPENVELAQDVGVQAFHEGVEDVGKLLIEARSPADVRDVLVFNWPEMQDAILAATELGWTDRRHTEPVARLPRPDELKTTPLRVFDVQFDLSTETLVYVKWLLRVDAWTTPFPRIGPRLPQWGIFWSTPGIYARKLVGGGLREYISHSHAAPRYADYEYDDLGELFLDNIERFRGFIEAVHELIAHTPQLLEGSIGRR